MILEKFGEVAQLQIYDFLKLQQKFYKDIKKTSFLKRTAYEHFLDTLFILHFKVQVQSRAQSWYFWAKSVNVLKFTYFNEFLSDFYANTLL